MGRSYLLVPGEMAASALRLAELDAETVAAYSALWQPELLAKADALPWLRDISDIPSDTDAIAIGKCANDALNSLLRTDLLEHKSKLLVVAAADDPAAVAMPSLDRTESFDDALEIRRDFCALGFAYLGLKVVYAVMTHDDPLDIEAFVESVRNAAGSFVEGDHEATTSSLDHCFDALHNARMSAYPATINWIELALCPPGLDADSVRRRTAATQPFNLIATGKELEQLSEQCPNVIEALVEAVQNNYLEILGSTFDDRSLVSLTANSALWQFAEASKIQQNLFGRASDCFGSRVGQLGPDLPQLLSKLGFRYGLHAAFDGSRHPHFREPKIQWTTLDGVYFECLCRTARDAADNSKPLAVFIDLGKSIVKDRSATVVLAHWLNQSAPWLDAILRIHRRAEVFGKFTAFSDYFLSSMLPDGPTRTYADEYASAPSHDVALVSDRCRNSLELQSRLDATAAIEALRGIADGTGTANFNALQSSIGRGENVSDELAKLESAQLSALAELFLKDGGQRGWLLVNPSSSARRACVKLPFLSGADAIVVSGPVKAVQCGDNFTAVVVDVPGWGYTWLSIEKASENASSLPTPKSDKPGSLAGLLRRKSGEANLASGRRLSNEFIEAEIDHRTGGLRGIWSARSGYSRLGQLLIFSDNSTSICRSLEVTSSGPALGEIVAKGVIAVRDGKAVANFQQRFSIWAARPVLEIETEFSSIDESAFSSNRYLASRWAWPDDKAKLVVADAFSLHRHRAGDFETPWMFELSERNLSTAVFPHGLPFHRRVGSRMADTPMFSSGSQTTSFRFSIGLDLAHPWATLADGFAPVVVVEASDRVPKAGQTGWLVHLSPGDVHCFQFVPVPGENPVARFGLIETAGKSVRATLRFCRNPSHARLVNAKGEMLYEVFVDGDCVHVDFSGHEMLFVEATF